MKRKLTIGLLDRMIVIAKMDPYKNDKEWEFFHGILWGDSKNDPGVILDLLKLARRMLIWRTQATAALARLQKLTKNLPGSK